MANVSARLGYSLARRTTERFAPPVARRPAARRAGRALPAGRAGALRRVEDRDVAACLAIGFARIVTLQGPVSQCGREPGGAGRSVTFWSVFQCAERKSNPPQRDAAGPLAQATRRPNRATPLALYTWDCGLAAAMRRDATAAGTSAARPAGLPAPPCLRSGPALAIGCLRCYHSAII